MASGKTTISLEATIHHALRNVFNDFAEKEGIMVKSVNIEWLDTSTADKFSAQVTEVEIDTITRR